MRLRLRRPGPPGCPAVVDPTGTWLSIVPLNPSENSGDEPKDPRLVALWRSAFAHANYVMLSGICAFRIPWTPALYRYFESHFVRLSGPYGLAFVRATPKTTAERRDLERLCAATRAQRASDD